MFLSVDLMQASNEDDGAVKGIDVGRRMECEYIRYIGGQDRWWEYPHDSNNLDARKYSSVSISNGGKGSEA